MECSFCRRGLSFLVRAEQSSASSASHSQVRSGRRELIAASVIAPWVSMVNQTSPSCMVGFPKFFLSVPLLVFIAHAFFSFVDISEVVIEGQDKVFKDVIEPLESVGVNMSPTVKQDLRDNGPPQQVAETLIKKVSATSRGKRALSTMLTGKFITQSSLLLRLQILPAMLSIGNGIIDLAIITFSFILFNFSHLYSVLSHLPCKTRMLVKLQFSLFCLGTSLFQSCLRHVSFHHVSLPVSFFVLLFPFPFVDEHLISEALRM
ncbi:hypothetical protein NC652_020479 [Populus alba x Populus x berolinensis]|nr:hypothetical protein NC652_020479 [Populus alba x Populus x berolinensis]